MASWVTWSRKGINTQPDGRSASSFQRLTFVRRNQETLGLGTLSEPSRTLSDQENTQDVEYVYPLCPLLIAETLSLSGTGLSG